MSLSQEPAFSLLQKYLVCGYKDITNEPYAGMSGRHDRYSNAVQTTNGAGPHNIQMFILSSDGTVLTCLPGYWAPQDLVTELRLAAQLDQVWHNTNMSLTQKQQVFTQMHMDHIKQHSPAMVNRSHLQGFDAHHEQQKANSDFVLASYSHDSAGNGEGQGWHGKGELKTTDIVMHERIGQRPFVPYSHFDVAAFSDYGLWKYDKQEDARMANGRVDMDKAHTLPTIGDPEVEKSHTSKNAQASQQGDQHAWGSKAWGGQ